MKKKFLSFIFTLCLIIPCGVMLAACGKEPEITLSDISVEVVDPNSTTVAYEPNVAELFDLEDFIITATYSDGSTKEITEGVTMTPSGNFDCVTGGDSKFIFTYQQKTAEVTIYITQRNIDNSDFVVTGVEDSYTLQNANDHIEPSVTITWNGTTLTENVDYNVFYGDNNIYTVGEDTGSITISGCGNYTGTKTINFDIQAITPTGMAAFVTSANEITFDGNNHFYEEKQLASQPEGVLNVAYSYSTDGGNTWLDENSAEIKNAGTYKIKAHFEMDTGYSQVDDIVKTVTITPMDINEVYAVGDSVTFDNKNFTINDNICLIKIKDEYDSAQLISGTDFIVDTEYNENGFTNGYKDNFNVTTEAQVRIKGQGNFTGSRSITFEIQQANVSRLTTFVDLQDEWTFTGDVIEPTFKLTYKGTELKKDTDYTVTYNDDKFAGNGRFYITYKGNYTGNETKQFTIKPYELDISCLQLDAANFVYNTQAQKIEISGSNLNTLIANVTQNNPDFVKLIFNPADISTIKYAIQTVYNTSESDYQSNIETKNFGTYYAHVNFVCIATDSFENTNYYNSIKLVNGETPITDTNNVICQSYTISQFEISSTNTVHQFVNEEYRTNSTVTYNSDYFDVATQLVVSFENSKSETLHAARFTPINAGTYTIEPNTTNTNYIFSKDTCRLPDLTFTINKVELTAESIETYIEMPTITCIEGDGVNKYKLSEFTSKLTGTNANENAELNIVDYNPQEKKFEVQLIADNYNLAENLMITPITTNVIKDLIKTVKMGTTGSDETTDVTDTFFTSNLLEVGKYFEFYYTEEFISGQTTYYTFASNCTEIYDTSESKNFIGFKVSITEEKPYIEFKIQERASRYTIATKTYYVTEPNKLINDDYLKNVYVLTSNYSNYYGLYEVVSGTDYGVDYKLDNSNFKFDNYNVNGVTDIINIVVETANSNVVSYLCSKSLTDMGITVDSDGSITDLPSEKLSTLQNNSIGIDDINNQETVYLICYSELSGKVTQKTMTFVFSAA